MCGLPWNSMTHHGQCHGNAPAEVHGIAVVYHQGSWQWYGLPWRVMAMPWCAMEVHGKAMGCHDCSCEGHGMPHGRALGFLVSIFEYRAPATRGYRRWPCFEGTMFMSLFCCSALVFVMPGTTGICHRYTVHAYITSCILGSLAFCGATNSEPVNRFAGQPYGVLKRKPL